MNRLLPQRCPVIVLYLNWLLYLGGAVALLVLGRYGWLGVWVVAGPPALYGYVRLFPRISTSLGYGSVADEAAPGPAAVRTRVTMYTGLGCPFCPIVEQRLRALQPVMGFDLDVVEVTSRPELARRERIGSVPVVVVEGRRRAGCATSRELAALIAGKAASSGTPEPQITI